MPNIDVVPIYLCMHAELEKTGGNHWNSNGTKNIKIRNNTPNIKNCEAKMPKKNSTNATNTKNANKYKNVGLCYFVVF